MVVNPEKQKDAYKFFYVNPEKCIGCNLCEYACSLKKTGDFNPLKSRIRIVRLHPFVNLALVCKLCDDPPCVTACPRNALTQDKETRVIRVDDEKCDGCSWCIEACPYGAVRYEPEIASVVICDLCDGEPECKEICPVEAIEFTVSDEDINKAWAAAYKKLVDEARKVISMAERKDLDIFRESTETIEKIDEKLRQLFEKQKK
jgi:carbon-monoxide dehydrogenase iron sulfur subunit